MNSTILLHGWKHKISKKKKRADSSTVTEGKLCEKVCNLLRLCEDLVSVNKNHLLKLTEN